MMSDPLGDVSGGEPVLRPRRAAPEAVNTTNEVPETSRSEGGVWYAPAGIGVAITLVSLCLALLGYGYALAVESMFGVDESLFADSPLDYLRLSSHVVGHWITAIPISLGTPGFYTRVYDDYWRLGFGFTALWSVVVLLWWFAGVRHRLQSMATAVVLAVRGCAPWRAFWRSVNNWKWPLFTFVGIWTWVPVGAWVLAALLVAASLLVSVVPLMGYATGLQSLQKWVVEPHVCVPLKGRQQRLAEAEKQRTSSTTSPTPVRGATCVQIRPEEKDKGELHQGRLVVATAKWAVLFNPETGAVRRVSVENAEIVPVASLEVPSVAAKTLTPAPPASPTIPPKIDPGSVVGTAGPPP